MLPSLHAKAGDVEFATYGRHALPSLLDTSMSCMVGQLVPHSLATHAARLGTSQETPMSSRNVPYLRAPAPTGQIEQIGHAPFTESQERLRNVGLWAERAPSEQSISRRLPAARCAEANWSAAGRV